MSIIVKDNDIELQVGNTIGYIYRNNDGVFKIQLDRINTIHLGLKSNSVVCKGGSYDLIELINNTRIAKEGKMILICEPFLTTPSYISHCKDIIDKWNKTGIDEKWFGIGETNETKRL